MDSYFWLVFMLIGSIACAPAVEVPQLIAYDCNQTHLDVLTYDLNRVEPCPLHTNSTINEEIIKVQIIQKKESDLLLMKRCHVTVQSLMWHCGMHSHTTMSHYDFAPHPRDLSRHDCSKMHADREIRMDDVMLRGLKINATSIVTTTIAGSLWGEGNCQGGTVEAGGYTYSNVVLRRAYTVKLQEQYVYFKVGTEEVVAFGGISCRLSDQSCYDHEVGRMIWNIPPRTCHKDMYDSLYAGRGKILTTTALGPHSRYLHVQTMTANKFQIFTPLLHPDSVCGLDVWTTPYVGLYIIIYKERPPFSPTQIQPANVDLIKYIESKFMTFAYGSALTMREFVQKLARAQCENHRETLLNRLHIVASNPSSANLLVQNKPGVFGRVAGEVVHLMQCPPVEVQLRKADHCSLEIPITYLDRDVYMDPRTRIIMSTYTYKECSILNPIMFRHGDHWVKMAPGFMPSDNPSVLHPTQADVNTFTRLTSYAQGGIYDPADLQQLRDFMLFSTRRDAMESNILAGLEGRPAPRYDITRVLHPEGWQALAKDRLRQMWGNMQVIGEWISGFLGIYFCIVVIKTIIGIIIRVFSIYRITGLSWALCCGIWSAFTQLFMSRLSPSSEQHMSSSGEKDIELQPQEASAPPTIYPRVTVATGL